MPLRKLDKIFKPENVALVGASEKEGSVGRSVMGNLKKRSKGKVFPVSLNRDTVLGVEAYSSVKDIPEPVDLAVIATPAPTVPGVVEECGEVGIIGIVIISAGFSETGEEGAKLEEKVEEIRKEYGMRIVGPNCLGVINPWEDLNASFADQMPEPGNVTFLSQSGALASSTLDWAISAQFGFSSFVSVGNMMDIDFSDLIDYFGRDPQTESILMYIEAIENAQRFMSAARSFARTQPILAVKSGRHKEGAQAVASHTGSLAGSDEVYDSAFNRAGVTRVKTIEDLFTSSEVLAKQNLPEGARLAIVTNAGGPGAMATDALIEYGGELASLSESTVEKLENCLPGPASLANPVDVTGGANAQQYRSATEICLGDENVDGVLCMYTPVGTLLPADAADSIVGLENPRGKPILASWMGGAKIRKGNEILRQNGIPVQSAPEQSVKVFMDLNRYARNIERLLETPEELPIDRELPKTELKAMIRSIAEQGRELLTERESKKILNAYGIPGPEVEIANSPDEAAKVASDIGYPVVLKIYSHDVTHKSHFGGVELDLNSEQEVREAYETIMERVSKQRPEADLEGVSVQEMVKGTEDELILGSKRDVTFGSTIMFGRGGTEVEHYADTAIGFPPLNQTLARYLMEETRIYKKLEEYENSSKVFRKLEEYLVRLSQLIIEFPEIKELDVNPLSKRGDDFVALDARVVIDEDMISVGEDYHDHLVIEPYPRRYIEEWELEDGTPVTLRPIRPEDEPLEFELFETFSEKTWRQRFFGPMREVTHDDMVRFTNIDYRREMAIVGMIEEEGERKMIGIGRLVMDPDENSGEYAVTVGDPWQERGLGTKLTKKIVEISREKGLDTVYSTVLKENERMIKICKNLGFDLKEPREKAYEESLKFEDFKPGEEFGDTVRAVLSLN